ELVPPGPEREQRARDLPPAAVGLVELVVDRRAGAVVLAHRVDRLRVTDAAEVVGERLPLEPRAVAAEVELVWGGRDQPLWKRMRLGEEEPVPVDEPELHVGPVPHLSGRNDV